MSLKFLFGDILVYAIFVWGSRPLLEGFVTNTSIQLLIFIPVACIPALIYKRMWFVDIAWTLGLTLIGIQTLFLMPGSLSVYQILIGICYIFQGGRMLLGATVLILKGEWTVSKPDLPRYQYAMQKFIEEKKDPVIQSQIDILIQCAANITALGTPALILPFSATSNVQQINGIHFILFICWLACLTFETKADLQKKKWKATSSREDRATKVCDQGMWSWCRHPNYFFEWMTWNSLALLSLYHVWSDCSEQMPIVLKLFFTVQLLLIPRVMYTCLVDWTGARPAEFFSAKKRPGYAKYIQNTPCFFPRQISSIFQTKKQ